MTMKATGEQILAEAGHLIQTGTSRRKMDKILKEKFGQSIAHSAYSKLYAEPSPEKKAISKPERIEILAQARRLLRRGTPRRKLDRTLQEQYGQSIGHDVHHKLFVTRMQELEYREMRRPRGYSLPQTRYEERFTTLRQKHFLPEEARELATKLHTLVMPEAKTMVEQRLGLYRRFLRKATSRGYSPEQFRAAWRRTVEDWYLKHRLEWRIPFERYHKERKHIVERIRIVPDIWGWFGYVKSQLPPDQQTGTPKKHRRRTQRLPTINKIQVSKWINELEQNLKATTDPAKRAQFREQLRNLRQSIR